MFPFDYQHGQTFGLVYSFHLALVLFALGLTYFIYVCIRNRYFHPLSAFPGPFWGSITDWYLVYVIKSVPTYGLDLHKQYGTWPTSAMPLQLLTSSRPHYSPVSQLVVV